MTLRPISDLKLHGGDPALDLVNSVDDRGTPLEQDFIAGYDNFIRWCGHAGLLDASEVRRLRRWGKDQPGKAATVAAQAVELREALRGLLEAHRLGTAPQPEHLRSLNALVPARSQLEHADGTFRLAREERDGEAPLRMLALRALQLLASDLQHRIRFCAGEGCDWYFLDRSRSKPRRWCSMAGCGNRAKGRRHSERKRAAP